MSKFSAEENEHLTRTAFDKCFEILRLHPKRVNKMKMTMINDIFHLSQNNF